MVRTEDEGILITFIELSLNFSVLNLGNGKFWSVYGSFQRLITEILDLTHWHTQVFRHNVI